MNKKTFKIENLTWAIEPLTYEMLEEDLNNGLHVSDWVFAHGKYLATNIETNKQFYVSHFYKRDLKEIMNICK
jgi:hypothetical protein